MIKLNIEDSLEIEPIGGVYSNFFIMKLFKYGYLNKSINISIYEITMIYTFFNQLLINSNSNDKKIIDIDNGSRIVFLLTEYRSIFMSIENKIPNWIYSLYISSEYINDIIEYFKSFILSYKGLKVNNNL